MEFLILFLIVMPVINLHYFTFYPPTAILHYVPILKNLRCPTRFINVIMLISPIIIFYTLENHFSKKNITIIISTVLFIVTFIEYYPKQFARISYTSIPRVYYELAKKPKESVLVYPLGLRDGFKLEGRFDIETMMYQTIYKKKTMGGYPSRLPDWIWYVHYQNPFTNSLIQLEKDTLYKIPNSNYISAIKSLKLDYVVIPGKYKNEKAARFLDSIVQPFCIKKEEVDGDLLITLKR